MQKPLKKKNKKQAKNYTGAEICIVKSIKNLFKNFKRKPLKFFISISFSVEHFFLKCSVLHYFALEW